MQDPLDGYLKLHDKANDRTIPANWKRGIINAIYPSSGTADVQVVGSHSTIIKAVFFSTGINPSTVKVGDKCILWMFSEINPSDSFVLAIYGRKVTTSAYGFVSISVTNAVNGVHSKIAHTLGTLPTFACISTQTLMGDPGGASPFTATGGTYIDNTVSSVNPGGVAFDASYIYVTTYVNDSSTHNLPLFWFASCA